MDKMKITLKHGLFILLIILNHTAFGNFKHNRNRKFPHENYYYVPDGIFDFVKHTSSAPFDVFKRRNFSKRMGRGFLPIRKNTIWISKGVHDNNHHRPWFKLLL